MTRKPILRAAFLRPRMLAAVGLYSSGIFLGMLSFGAAPVPKATSAATQDSSGWSIVASPNSRPSPTNNFISGMTCLSDSDCWSVGFYENASVFQTLTEHWDGSSWTITDSPNVSLTEQGILRSVACISASDCWAAGSFSDSGTNRTLVEHWNGTSWSIVTSPNTSDTQSNYLAGISCVSASQCWAVGAYFNGQYQTLIERWDGSSWTIVSSPNANTMKENILNSVACVSGSDCFAVGWYVNATTGIYQTLIEHWNGVAWTIAASPNSTIPLDNRLLSVTCTGASNCWGVGYYNNGSVQQTLIERWDGSSWGVVNAPNTLLTQENRLYAVTCRSLSECWAVGHANNGTTDQTLIERWDGTSWSITASANQDSLQPNHLAAAACGTTACWATGQFSNGTVQQTLGERWNGTSWALGGLANANASQNNTLLGVTCVAAADCWTVASYYNGSVQQTLIQHWDGNSWTIANSPNTSTTQSNILYDVACLSSTDCWTIGYANNGTAFQTLTLHWDGTAWNIVSSPNPPVSQNNFLNDITCNSSADCWAVGFYDTGTAYQTLIEHWDGTAWSIISSPNTDTTHQNRLYGVTCNSATDCWAVGRYFNGTAFQTLIEQWDGSAWNIVASPNTSASEENYLWSVTCATSSECWAVGSYGPGDGTGNTLIERWDGTSWAIAVSPNPPAQFNYNFLRSVTCASALNCLAVGYYVADGVDHTLVESWDGTSWTIVSSPNTSVTQNNFLLGVTCLSTSDCWATGYHYADNGILETLTEHFTANIPLQLASVVSRKTHGGTNIFDINLPLTGSPGIECRRGSVSGDYTLVYTFVGPITNCGTVTGAAGSVSVGADSHQCIANVSGLPSGAYSTITLQGVTDSTSTTADFSASIGILIGDTNADTVVNSADIGQTKSQSGNIVTENNFREDLNADGVINSADIGLVKSKSGTALP